MAAPTFHRIKVWKGNIYLFCDINSETAQEFVIALDSLKDAGQNLYIKICSFGGCVHSALSMYNALLQAQSQYQITTINEGACHSSATIILAGGQVRAARKYSSYLIHDVRRSFGSSQVTHSKLNDLVYNDGYLKDIYADILCNSRFSREQFWQAMSDEKIMSADICQRLGLIDHIW